MVVEQFYLPSIDLQKIHPHPTHLWYCGHWQLRLLTEWYKSWASQNIHIRQWNNSFLTYINGQMSPRTFLKKTKESWLHWVAWRFVWTTEQILTSLKRHISTIQKPVVIVIGHGYNDRDWTYNSLRKSIILQHYISIWGYDETGVYVYDSTLPENTTLPVWNLHIPYASLLYYRSRGYGKLYSYNSISLY